MTRLALWFLLPFVTTLGAVYVFQRAHAERAAEPERAAGLLPVEPQEPARDQAPVRQGSTPPLVGGGIQWFATWESGLQEAQQTSKPILLVSGAPHCAGVSGIW